MIYSLKTLHRHFEEAKKGDRILYLLKDGNTTIGTVSLLFMQDNPDEPRLFGTDTVHINHLRIHPDYQDRKLSSLLNAQLEENARKTGLKTLTIGVEPTNQKAIDVYSHWGYKKIPGISRRCRPRQSREYYRHEEGIGLNIWI